MRFLAPCCIALAALFIAEASAFAGDGALLMVRTEGQISDVDTKTYISAAEQTLSAGETATLRGLSSTHERLAGVAPEVIDCDDPMCLSRAGLALEVPVGYTVDIVEEFESFSIDVTAYDLNTGAQLGNAQETCDICTVEEATETLRSVAKQTTSGWTYPTTTPGKTVAEVKKDPPKKVVSKTEVRPVRIAIYAVPETAAIFIDGHQVGTGQFIDSIAPGEHRVRVEHKGYTSSIKEFEVKEGDGTLHLAIDLSATPQDAVITDGRSGGWVDDFDYDVAAWWFTSGGVLATIGGSILLGLDGEITCAGDDITQCPDVFNTGAGGAALLGIGIASITAGVTLFLWDDLAGRPRPGQETDDLAVSFGLSQDPESGDTDGARLFLSGTF